MLVFLQPLLKILCSDAPNVKLQSFSTFDNFGDQFLWSDIDPMITPTRCSSGMPRERCLRG
jgi:hypothetical protein